MTNYVHVGQDYASQVANNNPVYSGNPGFGGDGVNWPYDPNGNTPDPSQFQVNWNDPNAVKEAEAAYERLVNWIRQNPGCYNAYIMLLQMTTDIGMHMKSLPPAEQAELGKFLSTELQIKMPVGNESLMQMIVQAAAEGTAVSQQSKAAGEAAAHEFLAQLEAVTSQLQGYGPPFSTMYNAAAKSAATIDSWCDTHYKVFVNPVNGNSHGTWIDDNGLPISSFSSFANMIAFTLGNDLENNSNVQDVINSYYQDRIRQLVAEFKGNPWGLLIALMNLINNRDEDDGMAVNGYGNNLNVLRKANGLIQQMLGDITSNPPNAVDFFKTMQKLKTLVEQDPALSSVVKQLESDMGIINNQVVPANTQLGWNVSAGYYNFPPGTTIVFNGKTIQVSGETYLPGGYVSIPSSSIPAGGFTFGQIVAMGGSVEVGELMGDWSTTLMSNFENGVTGIQTLLNGASPAIQQEIQNTTQMMQARENFEKQAFSSITNVIQQITRLTSQAGS